MKAIDNTNENIEHFLIDGFPRNEENMKRYLSRRGEFPDLHKVYFIDVALEKMEEWVRSRKDRLHREDDKPEIFDKRVKIYNEHTLWVIEQFEAMGKLQKIIQTEEDGKWIDTSKYNALIDNIAADILASGNCNFNIGATETGSAF